MQFDFKIYTANDTLIALSFHLNELKNKLVGGGGVHRVHWLFLVFKCVLRLALPSVAACWTVSKGKICSTAKKKKYLYLQWIRGTMYSITLYHELDFQLGGDCLVSFTQWELPLQFCLEGSNGAGVVGLN